MHQATGELVEIYLENGLVGGRVLCPPNLAPPPGRYLQAHRPASDDPLPVSVFSAGLAPGGFLLAPPIPESWHPGIALSLRGPLGSGFSLPVSARRIALIALAETPSRLKSLLADALKQAAVVLLSDYEIPYVPSEVELQPLAGLGDVIDWADYLAFDVARESLPDLGQRLARAGRVLGPGQVLVHTPMPCGGMAECAVCALRLKRGWKLACKHGPVFALGDLVLE